MIRKIHEKRTEGFCTVKTALTLVNFGKHFYEKPSFIIYLRMDLITFQLYLCKLCSCYFDSHNIQLGGFGKISGAWLWTETTLLKVVSIFPQNNNTSWASFVSQPCFLEIYRNENLEVYEMQFHSYSWRKIISLIFLYTHSKYNEQYLFVCLQFKWSWSEFLALFKKTLI